MSPSRQEYVIYLHISRASNQDTIKGSCENHGWGDNNSDAETQAVKDSIESESAASGVPKELILAIMMQESKGCVRAPTTASDAPNRKCLIPNYVRYIH